MKFCRVGAKRHGGTFAECDVVESEGLILICYIVLLVYSTERDYEGPVVFVKWNRHIEENGNE